MVIRALLLAAASFCVASQAFAQEERARAKTVEEELVETDVLATSLRERMSKLTLPRNVSVLCNEAVSSVTAVSTTRSADRRAAYKLTQKKVSKCNRLLTELEQKAYRDALTDADFAKLALDGVSRITDHVKLLRRTATSPTVLDEVLATLDEVAVELVNNDPRAAFELVEQARNHLQEAEDAVSF